ncbi:DUF5983 family protein [Franconibacter helveticus]|uniref:DUF5983 family protein n=1 Tax=Franconibacter helveticus TaxID=357240 RepID=UPI000DA19AA0|nr:DUF5983 family protein [Franconibacter helveticus]
MRFCLQAPYGVTFIVLDNLDEAFYLNGEFIDGASWADRDDSVRAAAECVARALGVPFRELELAEPEHEDWCWNDVVDALGWGNTLKLSPCAVRSVLTCSTAHITPEDKNMLDSFSRSLNHRHWVLKNHGYIIRYDGQQYPELFLKHHGFSRTLRRLVATHRRTEGSMLHLSPDGDVISGLDVYEW